MIIPPVFWVAFTVWIICMGYVKLIKIRKARAMDHNHDRNWTRKEYFQHIKEEHPDIWKEYFEGEEE